MANPYWRYSRKQFRTEAQPLAPGPVAGKHIEAFRRTTPGHEPQRKALEGRVTLFTNHMHEYTPPPPLLPGLVARTVVQKMPPLSVLQGRIQRFDAYTYGGAVLTFLPIVGEGQTVIPWPSSVRVVGPGGLSTIG